MGSTEGGSRGASAFSVCSAPGWGVGTPRLREDPPSGSRMAPLDQAPGEWLWPGAGRGGAARPNSGYLCPCSRCSRCLGVNGSPSPRRHPPRGRSLPQGPGCREVPDSASQLTAGRALSLAAPLLLGLPVWARGWTASGRVQLAQHGSSRLFLFGSLVSSWRWNGTVLPFPTTRPPPGGVRWPRTCWLFQILPGETSTYWLTRLLIGHPLHARPPAEHRINSPGCCFRGGSGPGQGADLTRKAIPPIRAPCSGGRRALREGYHESLAHPWRQGEGHEQGELLEERPHAQGPGPSAPPAVWSSRAHGKWVKGGGGRGRQTTSPSGGLPETSTP